MEDIVASWLTSWIYGFIYVGGGGGGGENAGEGKLRNYSYQLIFAFLHGVDMEKLIMKM